MTKEIALTRGYVALVDDEDYEWLSQWKWYAVQKLNGTIYAAARDHQNKVLMHRVILSATTGQQIDHTNGDGLDNQRSNLRFCTHAENQYNSHNRIDNTSGWKGVRKLQRKWSAQIRAREKRVYLGRFDSPIDAARAYNKAALELHGEFARLNVIPGDTAGAPKTI